MVRFAGLAGLCVAALAAGSSYAAWVPRNSVGPNQIRRGAVTSQKIRTAAVKSPEIARGAVTSGEIAQDAVGAGEIAAGALPRAYALIQGWPEVGIDREASQRMDQASATLGSDGYVCIDGLGFEAVNIQTTVAGTGQNALNSVLNVSSATNGVDLDQCPGSEDVGVVAIDAASGVFDPTPPGFYITFYD